jgi:putative acetyltransferase
MSITITPERPDAADATTLIMELESYLEQYYAVESRHGYSVQKLITENVAFFVARQNRTAAGCGGILLVGSEYAEVKRMYVRPEFRGQGVGRQLLQYLIAHAHAHGLEVVRLETGIYQPEAIRLYEAMGFRRIPPFGPYWADPVSLCYEMQINQSRCVDTL